MYQTERWAHWFLERERLSNRPARFALFTTLQFGTTVEGRLVKRGVVLLSLLSKWMKMSIDNIRYAALDKDGARAQLRGYMQDEVEQSGRRAPPSGDEFRKGKPPPFKLPVWTPAWHAIRTESGTHKIFSECNLDGSCVGAPQFVTLIAFVHPLLAASLALEDHVLVSINHSPLST